MGRHMAKIDCMRWAGSMVCLLALQAGCGKAPPPAAASAPLPVSAAAAAAAPAPAPTAPQATAAADVAAPAAAQPAERAAAAGVLPDQARLRAAICTPDWSDERCAIVMRAANDLVAAEASPQAQAVRARNAEIEANSPTPAAMIAASCVQRRAELPALQQRLRNPAAGEIITAEERAAMPADIADAERFIAANCR
jgi:hypothetical protein